MAATRKVPRKINLKKVKPSTKKKASMDPVYGKAK